MDQDPAVQLFGTEDFDLYATLGLDKTATVDQIKSAYRKLALKFHPDKQVCATEEDKAAAATKFQQAGYSYSILSDDARRKRYDDTGRTDASLFPDDAKAWQAYFEELWTGQVNAATIDDFFDKYEGTEEEKNDFVDCYKELNGDIVKMLEHCMTRDAVTAEQHIEAVIDQAIKEGALTATTKWKQSRKNSKAKANRAKKAEAEAKEAEEMAKDMGVHDKLYGGKGKGKNGEEDGEAGLKALMQQRGAQRMQASLAALEAKYGGGSSSSSKSETGKSKKRKSANSSDPQHPPEDISDADFEALQAKMFGGDKKKKSKDDGDSNKKRKSR